MCWLNFSCAALVLHICALQGRLKKDHLTTQLHAAFSLKNMLVYKFAIWIITNKWVLVIKTSKPVSKETFIKASKVVDKPSKVAN